MGVADDIDMRSAPHRQVPPAALTRSSLNSNPISENLAAPTKYCRDRVVIGSESPSAGRLVPCAPRALMLSLCLMILSPAPFLFLRAFLAAVLLGQSFLAMSAELPVGGKLLLTGGVSQIEGAAGGGLTPWAVIGGYGTREQFGVNVHTTFVRTQDYSLGAYGVTVGLADRVELSLSRQRFDTRDAGTTLGLGRGYAFNQNIAGAKLRVLGDAVLDADTWVPQVAIGAQYKHNEQGAILDAIGARGDSGVDYYVSATKLLLAQSILLNGTVRMTRANQFGLLGFGGDLNHRHQPQLEGSAAYLLSRRVAVGVEYRQKPNNLGFAREQNAYDAFIAWAPSKHVSLTLAWLSLGDIATIKNQSGVYLSAQAGF